MASFAGLVTENIKLMQALQKAREYIELDARNKKYPLAIETLAIIDAVLDPMPTMPSRPIAMVIASTIGAKPWQQHPSRFA